MFQTSSCTEALLLHAGTAASRPAAAAAEAAAAAAAASGVANRRNGCSPKSWPDAGWAAERMQGWMGTIG